MEPNKNEAIEALGEFLSTFSLGPDAPDDLVCAQLCLRTDLLLNRVTNKNKTRELNAKQLQEINHALTRVCEIIETELKGGVQL